MPDETLIAVPSTAAALPPLTAVRMAARYAALEARGNQGVVGRMDNARKIFQREERRGGGGHGDERLVGHGGSERGSRRRASGDRRRSPSGDRHDGAR